MSEPAAAPLNDLPAPATVEVDGLRIAYRRAGHGPPLVLLHGGISDSRVWRPQIRELSDEFDVVAWDAPGAGGSADPREPFGMADWADALARFLSAIEIPSAHVLGLSFGGSLALELYRRHPQAVASLILADTYAGWRGSLSAPECAERLEIARAMSAMAPDELVANWFADSGSAEPARELSAIMADFHPLGLRLMGEAMAECDLRDVLPSIEVPTLLLWGELDTRAPRSIAEEMLAAIPGARLAVIPGAGHDSNVDQPERFSAEVRAFCRAVSR